MVNRYDHQCGWYELLSTAPPHQVFRKAVAPGQMRLLEEKPLPSVKLGASLGPVGMPATTTIGHASKAVSAPNLGLGAGPPPGLGTELQPPPPRTGEPSNVFATLGRDDTRRVMCVRLPSEVPPHDVEGYDRQMERNMGAPRAMRTPQEPTGGTHEGAGAAGRCLGDRPDSRGASSRNAQAS